MICFRKRLRISSAVDADERLPDDLKIHLERCDACRLHYERQREITAMLRRPVDEKIGFPAGLNESIMRTIRAEPAPRKTRQNRIGDLSPWLAPVALASIALVTALILMLRNPEIDRPLTASLDSGLPEPVATSSGPAPGDYIRSWSTAIDRPLDNELESVVADAKTAVRFLAINFLPEDRTTESL